MARGTAHDGAPLRKELPCDFAPTKAARDKAQMGAAFAVVVGALLLWGGVAGGSVLTALVLGGLGVLLLGGGVLLGANASTSVRLDDEGLVIRRWGKARRIRWDDIASISFGATLKGPEHGPGGGGGVAGLAGRSLASYMADDVKRGDPYLVGRVRQQYQPSATVSDATRRGGASFSDSLGWGFFTALYAEADARGIKIVRV